MRPSNIRFHTTHSRTGKWSHIVTSYLPADSSTINYLTCAINPLQGCHRESLQVMHHEHVIREIAERYRQSGRSFNEFQRRHWAATEAMKLGRGGLSIVSKALRISPNTIKKGIQEIVSGQAELLSVANARIRKPGGGRKSSRSSATPSSQQTSVEESAATPSPPCSMDGFSNIPPDMSPLEIDTESDSREHM